MDLRKQEVVILDQDDDPMMVDDFESERLVDGSSVLLTAVLDVGREWGPEETESGGVTINTAQTPRLFLYDTPHGDVLVFSAEAPTPIAYLALLSGHGNRAGLLARAVESIEEGFDGIVGVREAESYDKGTNYLLDELDEAVEGVIPDE